MKDLHKFPGGLHLEGFKQLTCELETLPAIIPERLVFPLTQHIGSRSIPVVQIGEYVLKGQLIARPGSYVSSAIHASSSGVIEDIGIHPIADGTMGECIVIKTDGKDLWGEKMPPLDYLKNSAEILEQRITDSGIIGMGGAGFPSHVKVIEGADEKVDTLIINGVECEPYITCDDRLIRERPEEILTGTKILQKITGAKECVLAVEDDMPASYKSLIDVADTKDLNIVKVPAIYPAGGEKQLIRTLTGKWVPSHGLPIQLGVLVQNVATVAAIFRAVAAGEPHISRIVTVAGELDNPRNIEVLNGTPVGELLENFQSKPIENKQTITFGGGMMGKVIETDQVPVLKKTSCVLVQTQQLPKKEVSCIRCGDCIDVCPEKLQPQMLVAMAKKTDLDSLREYRLFDCIECRCCDQVCPSHIPLVQNFQNAKAVITEQDDARRRAEKSKSRYLARNRRLEREKEKKSSHKKKSSIVPDKNDLQAEVLAAIRRSKAKKSRKIKSAQKSS